MIREKLGDMIIEATKAQDKIRLQVLKLVKTEYQKLQTSRPREQEMTDQEEHKILQKMIEQRETSAETYKKAGRPELAAAELEEVTVLKSFLPEPMSEKETLIAVTETIAAYGEISGMRDLKPIISLVQSEYPQIPTAVISKIFRETLNS